MKVIGEQGYDTWICVVSKQEVEKVFDKYYAKGADALEKIKIGSEIDLGVGHDFRANIRDVCHEMRDAMKAFESARATLMKFAVMVSDLPPAKDTAA